jgi:RimJ/RimL family protein N-acetyltransferase
MDDPILVDVPEELVGRRTIVRPFRPGDGAAVWAAIDESREHVFPWLPWGKEHRTVAETEAFVRRKHAEWMSRADLAVSMWDRKTGRFVGGAGLHRIDWRIRSFEIGYWVRKSAQGRGHVTECVELLTRVAFVHLDAKRVWLRCAVGNERSIAIPKRLGFVHEGMQRNGILLADGRHVDAFVFSMTPADRRKRKPVRVRRTRSRA